MCGIAGIVHFDGKPVEPEKLLCMSDIMAHRGPDGEGQWTSGSVGLAHRRLSIIDLTAQANQPMFSEDGQIAIVFNGEIYNYRDLLHDLQQEGIRFSTQSDTEVILHLYRLHGTECISRLRGMFALAIWDQRRQELFLARDRIGIKPLYYLRKGNSFAFGSEIKSVVASGLSDMEVSKKAMAGLMRFLVVPQPETIFTDIDKLEPGRQLIIRMDGTVREEIYWAPPAVSELYSMSERKCIEDLDSQLNESIRYHMIADVPVSAFLSGGLDSSAVVTLMRHQAPEASLNSYSITFPGQLQFDEGPYARKVAEHNRIGHHIGTINEDFLTDIDDIAWYLDEPFAVSSAFATYYLARHAAEHTKVVLTGDGGDELFAGYEGYKNDSYLKVPSAAGLLNAVYGFAFASMQKLGSSDPALRRLLGGLRKRLGSEGLRYSERSAQNSIYANGMAFTSDYFYSGLSSWKQNLMARYYDDLQVDNRLDRKLFAEFKTRLVDEMLMKVDRMTMAHSLEARVPLLDHKVVEYAFGIPAGLKLRQNDGVHELKYILKKTMEPYLPNEIIYRQKQGFNIPVRSWLQGKFLNDVAQRISGGVLERAGVIEPRGVLRVLQMQKTDRGNFTNLILILLLMESWASRYQEKFGQLRWA